ncbi:tyrosine-type recombinase/integrase [Nitrosomonas oligotropha]|uniref:Phage integrase family protein n=1 Tax=Nitrosomonas oligotropha TaxID=42354 RepID=A0A1H8JS67_9PROT|nr:integrase arm-type DNA-binding domain-containing protein [Nitrosomonas oligotropha]SDW00937.1 Phage integrase family protein [Nitrosomonas oligotropha]SEN83550.1 Phage integrase family protein [Nitrosomonas oligotropha]
MKWDNFTADRVASFKCKEGSKQSIFWDGKQPGLGLRVTASGAKSYIFQTELHGKTLRITIGNYPSWSISAAQEKAASLKVITDQGVDPRQVETEKRAAKEAAETAKKAQETRETVTLAMAWEKYLTERKRFWSERHYSDHVNMMQPGGEKRARSSKLTVPGVLRSLANVRLIDLTQERVQEWANEEGAVRAGRARLAFRLLKVFLTWCGEHAEYRDMVVSNAAKNKKAREILGKPETMNGALQKEQLPAWFNAAKQLNSPVMAAYLQALLLTGSRPNEISTLKWEDIDFQWCHMTIKDKVEGLRVIPLPPYLSHLLAMLPRRNQWVFSGNSASGHIIDARKAHEKVCAIAGVKLDIYGFRRSFASFCDWVQMPAGISAQIQGHKPSALREKHYIRRELDLLRLWHVKIERWILEQAGIEFVPTQAGLQIVKQ